jgi:hypothetical protein
MDMTNQKRKRGNEWTPWIHTAAVVCSFLVVAVNAKGITTINFWPSFGRGVALLFGLEIVFAIVFSAIAVVIDGRAKGRDERILRKL